MHFDLQQRWWCRAVVLFLRTFAPPQFVTQNINESTSTGSSVCTRLSPITLRKKHCFTVVFMMTCTKNVPLSLTLRFDMVIDPVSISIYSLFANLVPLTQVTFPSVTMAITVTGACFPCVQRKVFRGCIGLVMCNVTLSPFRFVTMVFAEITATEMERNSKIKPSMLSK